MPPPPPQDLQVPPIKMAAWGNAALGLARVPNPSVCPGTQLVPSWITEEAAPSQRGLRPHFQSSSIWTEVSPMKMDLAVPCPALPASSHFPGQQSSFFHSSLQPFYSNSSQKRLHPRVGEVFSPVWYAVFVLIYTDFHFWKCPRGKTGCEYLTRI